MSQVPSTSNASEQAPKVRVRYLSMTGVDSTHSSGGSDKKIAQLTLNKPKALNALDLDMVNLLLETLAAIRSDNSVAAVMLDSAGDRAFCAGGDIVSMYTAMKDNVNPTQTDEVPPTPLFLQDFFTQEYRLDYCLHTFNKPVIVWGNGIIMGGGLGLFAASQIKLVTETARIAMPEISIGLFPDVGASYFLNRLAPGLGLFLGLTGASINAKDSVSIKMADAIVPHARKDEFIKRLCTLNHVTKQSVSDLAATFHETLADMPDEILADNMQSLSSLSQCSSLSEAVAKLHDLLANHPENTYLKKSMHTFQHGSPITAHLLFEQLKRGKSLSLAECFRMELSMAFTCGALGEFEEGVRALLIDKDNKPAWRYGDIAEVPESIIQDHFSQFADASGMVHPLINLEQDFGA
jgi:enoyl-CoA hydratase/carnithine racemase